MRWGEFIKLIPEEQQKRIFAEDLIIDVDSSEGGGIIKVSSFEVVAYDDFEGGYIKFRGLWYPPESPEHGIRVEGRIDPDPEDVERWQDWEFWVAE